MLFTSHSLQREHQKCWKDRLIWRQETDLKAPHGCLWIHRICLFILILCTFWKISEAIKGKRPSFYYIRCLYPHHSVQYFFPDPTIQSRRKVSAVSPLCTLFSGTALNKIKGLSDIINSSLLSKYIGVMLCCKIWRA